MSASSKGGSGSANVRLSAIADTWYPGTAATLRRTVEGYLAEAQQGDAAVGCLAA